MAEPGAGARTAVLGAAIAVLLLASVAALVFGDFDDDSPSTSAAPSTTAPRSDQRAESTKTTQPSGPPQPVTNACALVSIDSVASAIKAKPADLKPEPATSSNGLKCEFKAPEGEDVLVGFTVQLIEANDATFARSTIEGRSGKRISELGDVAVLEQRDVSSQISVAKGTRYVQLQTQRKPTTDDAMIDLGRQAVAKL